MSATIAVYEYHDDMDEKTLTSMGVIDGVLGQLKEDVPLEEQRELRENTDGFIIGETKYKFCRQIPNILHNLTVVDDETLSEVEDLIDEYADENEGGYDSEALLEWLETRRGKKVFTQGL